MRSLSFDRFLSSQQVHDPCIAELTPLLESIANACKRISMTISQGDLLGIMGSLDQKNIQGETQKQLDVICNDIFIADTGKHGLVAAMASEELEHPHLINHRSGSNAKYLLVFDPLDGSSNVNVNISVGTIFSILRCPSDATPVTADFLQQGKNQICAGYALYGSSTMLVLTTGHGVNGFTLNTEKNEFLLTHPRMTIPADTSEFSINMSNYRFWDTPVRRYIDECLQGKEGPRGKDFNMRWVGSMAADVHRILVRGGVFIYPVDRKTKKQGGKLRLLYEASPMSFIVEQADGAASTGDQKVMDVLPEILHQRIPVILGSKNEVERLVGYHHSGN
ncbi:MAG: class 1 fructose-bisphosphatase [Methylophilaceae bacterium]|nr:class 1 fructose-bisphosphatase [Methylophilaceae bacterium]